MSAKRKKSSSAFGIRAFFVFIVEIETKRPGAINTQNGLPEIG